MQARQRYRQIICQQNNCYLRKINRSKRFLMNWFKDVASEWSLFSVFDAEDSSFSRSGHRNEMYLAFSMRKIAHFRGESIGMEYFWRFRCEKMLKCRKKASKIDCRKCFRCLSLKKASNIVGVSKFDAFHLFPERSAKPCADQNTYHAGYLFSLFWLLHSYDIYKRLFLSDP